VLQVGESSQRKERMVRAVGGSFYSQTERREKGGGVRYGRGRGVRQHGARGTLRQRGT
jgi:hypothetical protein